MGSTNQLKTEGTSDAEAQESATPSLDKLTNIMRVAAEVEAIPEIVLRQLREAIEAGRHAVAIWKIVDGRVEFALHLTDFPHADMPIMVAQLKDQLADQLRKASSVILSGNGAPFPRLPAALGGDPEGGPSP